MSRRSSIILAVAVAGVLAAALAARYGIIQPRDAAHLCAVGDGPWWCGPRAVLVVLFPWSPFGWVSFGAGGLAILSGWRPAAVAALLVGAAGLVFYDAEPASVGVVLGLIVVTRQAGRRSGAATGPAGREEGPLPSTAKPGC
jgi:hypothetical protein